MMIQYAKFKKLADEKSWRKETPSLNYIETSTLWRQEHNGYSHQDPMFISNLINLKGRMIGIYFPPDANCFLSTLDHCLNTKERINLLVGTKNPFPVFLSMEEAVKHCIAGASIWPFASTHGGVEPDVVLVGCGNETNLEVIAASKILMRDLPFLRIRMVNVTNLMVLDITRNHAHRLDNTEFEALFTPNKPVIFNFHGYPGVIFQLLSGRGVSERFHVSGYIEEGTTTTPFSMLSSNCASRFHLAINAILEVSKFHPEVAAKTTLLVAQYKYKLQRVHQYIREYNQDPKELFEFDSFYFDSHSSSVPS